MTRGGAAELDPAVAGHKFARQDRLRRKGFPVPEFVCLPADVFDAVVTPVLPPPGPDPLAWAEQARDRVRTLDVPRDAAELVTAFVTGPVAVRACAAGDEDGAADPFAGLSDSFLDVRSEDVLRRVVDCWASAFTPEAVGYRVRRGLDPRATRIAVGVQRMIHGTRSFVAFTRDPVTGADVRTVAAAPGNGEGVVQEKADIDHFFLDPATDRVRSRLAPRPSAVPVLNDDEVREICALADRVAEEFGGPQDVEGTVTADGRVHLLQARPIVAPAGQLNWTNHNITESFPGTVGALTYSQARVFYERGFGDFYRRMGVPARTRRRTGADLGRMIGYLRGQVYYRLDAWYALHGELPGFAFLRGTWERSMGVTPTPSRVDKGTFTRLVRRTPILLARAISHTIAVKGFLRWWDALVANRSRLDDAPAGELVDAYRTLWTEFGQRWGITLVNSYFALIALKSANALLARWARPDLLTGLLCGGPDNRSLAALRSTIALAELVAAHPEARDAVLHGEDHDVWSRVDANTYGTGIADAAREHLRRYGDRAPNDLKLETSTPREQPWTLVASIRPFAASGLTVAANRAREEHARADAQAQLRAVCPNPLRRLVIGAAMARVRRGIRVREDARFCRSQLYGISRQILRRLGEILAGAGRLEGAEDVFHLTVDEVLGAFDGTLPGADLRPLAAHRREELARWTEPLPASFTTDPGSPLEVALPAPATETGDSATVLHGLPSARGRVRARAAVISDPSIAPETCRDRIIVARETDPGWLLLMLAAKGIVVERGSLLSHTAITGRLLGIPTVVAVPGATRRIEDGCWLELDGEAGTVRLVGAR